MAVYNMKKNIGFLFIIFFASFNLFSQEINYRALENCQSISGFLDLYADNSIISNLDGYEKYKKDTLFKFILNDETEIYGSIETGYKDEDMLASVSIYNSEGDYKRYSLDYIELTKYDKLPGFSTDTTKDYPKTGLLLLPQKYYRVLNKNSVKELFKEEPYWENGYYENLDNNRYDSWTEIFYPTSLFISNSYFCYLRSDCDELPLHDVSGLITSIKKIDSSKYRIEFYNEVNVDKRSFADETFKLLNSNHTHFFLLEYDGDYVNVFLDSEDNLVDSFVISSDFIRTKLFELAKNGKTTTSNITWPRHADGTCDYEDVSSVKTVSTPSTNVSKNKTMLVSENLKLRSGEATTSEVLTVMQAGTKVKILELGKAENIDGINSNWVKVEVQSGAKDREGNTISRGTVGWCYGGYLAETTEVTNFESTDTKEISDIKIEEAPKQEINIGIVCAIIGAVLLLLLVILIFAVRKKKDNP